MKESNSKYHKVYKLQVQLAEFVTRWILIMIVGPLFFSSFFIVGRIVINILLDIIFDKKVAPFETIREGIACSHLDIPFLFFLIVLTLYFAHGLRLYYRKDKDHYMEISDMGLVLDYGRKSLSWNAIESVILENNTFLIVKYKKEERHKKEKVALRWIADKEGFIRTVKNTCEQKKIRYCEKGLSLSSRMEAVLGIP
ncbi:MAG: hypothetical protein WBA22_11755 [Candidatus Methanofastidiosia archaeon]